MAEIKNLAKQTAIYGLSNILGKFLNWCLVPLYTYVLTSSSEYGIVTNLYAWTALLLVILTYGMETGFFRFVNKEEESAPRVYGSVLACVGATSLLFAVLITAFSPEVSHALGYDSHPEWVAMMGVIVAIDAFDCIPFAHIRYKKEAGRFAIYKFLMVIVNVVMNLFFLIVCPRIHETNPELIGWFYDPSYGVGYIFISNLISTLFVTALLIPQMLEAGRPEQNTLRRILGYSLPLLLLGIAGIMNQTVDKILFPYLITDRAVAQSELGIYGACFKVAMVMMVFTQAFRYAYEPFVFAQTRGNADKREEYVLAMKFFVIFSLLIFLGMMFYLDILKLIIRSDYWEGLRVVPIILISYLFQGIYFNLSIWYKLIDKTYWGAVLSMIGLVVTIAINVIFVPQYGYVASAAASFFCYLVIMIISYVLGQRYYKIAYDLRSFFFYFALAMVLYGISLAIPADLSPALRYTIVTMLLGAFVFVVLKKDLPITSVPVIGKFFRKKN